MTTRASTQAILAERLSRAREARHIVLRAPAGSGITKTVAEFAARSAASGFVVVVSSRLALLEQWAFVLEIRNAAPVRLLKSELALELANRLPAEPHRGVFLTTMPDIRRGPVRIALKSLPLALAVLDAGPQPDSSTTPAVLDIVEQARQTIVVEQVLGQGLPTWLHDPTLVELTLDEAITMSGERHANPETYPVSLSPAEHSIFEQAARLLDKRNGARSRPAVHSALMRLISTSHGTSHGDMDDIDMAWSLVDSLEALGPDPRLEAMTERVLQRRWSGPVIVITGPLRAEVEYVRDHLATRGIHAEQLTMHDPRKPKAVSDGDSPPSVIVATRNSLDTDESLLHDATLVYFTRPQSNSDRAWLMSALHTGAARAAIIPTDGSVDLTVFPA